MGESIILKYGRWGSPELHRYQLMPDDDDPYFKKVGGSVFIQGGSFKILLLSSFFLFWFISSVLNQKASPSPNLNVLSVPLIIKITLLVLASVLVISFVHFESSFDWPDFSAPPLFQNLLSSR